MHMALSAVVLTTVSILLVTLKAIPHRVWRAVLVLSSLMRGGYYRWMKGRQLYRETMWGLDTGSLKFLPEYTHVPLQTFEPHK